MTTIKPGLGVGDLIVLKTSFATMRGTTFYPGQLGVVTFIEECMLYSVLFGAEVVCCFRYELQLLASHE
jgi:hypothetical protein